MSAKWTGTKYDKAQDVADIAKLVRADIKAAITADELPQGLKCSVTIDRYSMGCSLDVHVTALPWQPLEWADRWFGGDRERRTVHTEAAKGVLETLQAIVDAYNRKDIDSQSDYYNVRFSDHVRMDYQFQRACEEALGADPEKLEQVVLRLVQPVQVEPDHTLVDWLEMLDQPEAPAGDWSDYIAREVL